MNRFGWLSVALVLTACSVQVVPAGTRASARPKASGAVKAVATALEPTPAAGTPTPATDTGLLRPPSGAAIALSGHVALDAAYAIRSGATIISDAGGSLIGDAGGSILKTVGSSLIANNGSNFIANDPGLLAAHGAGLVSKAKLVSKTKLISDAGGGIISDGGGSLISNNGGGLVSNNGGGLISNNGGGAIAGTAAFALLSRDGRSFGLTQAEAAIPHVSVPVAGMLVGVYSLAEGGLLPLGIDAQGAPVYVVFSDAQGGFTVHLPPKLAENVLVVSSISGTDDARLAVERIAATTGNAAVAVDDRHAAISGFLRQTLTMRMQEINDPDPCNPAPLVGDSVSTAGLSIALKFIEDVLKDPAMLALPRAARTRVVARIADDLVARAAMLETIEIFPAVAGGSKATGPAFPLLLELTDRVEKAAAARLNENPTGFDNKDYVQAVNRRRRPEQGPALIRKPADLIEFIANEYLGSNDPAVLGQLDGVLLDLGLPPSLRNDLSAAGGTLMAACASAILGQDEAATALNLARIREVSRRAIESEKGANDPEPACVPTVAPE